MKILRNWWSALLIIPAIAFIMVSLMDLLLYPLLTHEEFHIQMGSASAIKLVAVITAFIMAYVVSKLFKVSFANLIAFWILLTGIGLVTDSGNYEGNQQDGLALHIFVYQVSAIFATIVYTIIQLNRRKDRSAHIHYL